MARKRISKKTEAEVLLKSGRRCCLCFGLNYDSDTKAGQLAHIDHNSSNSEVDNLAFLCLEHHDQYDSRPSQSKGLTELELRRYRDSLYHFIGNNSSSTMSPPILKPSEDCFPSKPGEFSIAKKIRKTPQTGNEANLAYYVEGDYSTGNSAIDYITNSTQELQKELAYLSDKLNQLQEEKESPVSLGLSGSVKSVDAEVNKILSRIGICKVRNVIIEAGYDRWDRFLFNLTCESGGFLDIWETIGEMKGNTFHSNPESDIRIPISIHEYFRKAIDSRLFTEFLVCLLYDDWDEATALGTNCNYYLFGASPLDDGSVFFVDAWTINEL
jgi:hypothetical protein